MARLEKEAKERERQRQIAEAKDIQKKHALERIEQLKKSELGARVVQKIDEEVIGTVLCECWGWEGPGAGLAGQHIQVM